MVIITGTGCGDDEAPSRSIFDPPNVSENEDLSNDGWENTTFASSHADTLTTRDTMSTAMSGSPGRRRQQRKHPSQLNEVELRIQLWDAYRLARIILGTPIKSSSLRGKTILHSIRKVAEMKLELIRLQKEVQMAKVVRDSGLHGMGKQANENFTSEEATVKTSPNRHASLNDQLNFQIADILIPGEQPKPTSDKTPMKSNRASRKLYDDDIPTPPRQNKSFSLEQRLDLYKIRYERLQTTHDEMMQEFQTQLLEMQVQLQQVESTPGNSEQELKSDAPAADGKASSSMPINSSKQAVQSPTRASQPGSPSKISPSKKHSWDPVESPLKTRGSGPRSSSKKTKGPISRADDTMNAVAAVARKHDLDQQTPEELQLRTVLARKSNAVRPRKVASSAATTSQNDGDAYSQERQKLLDMIEELMKRVEKSSEETKEQFHSLQEKLRSYQGDDASDVSDNSSTDMSDLPVFLASSATKQPEIQNQQQFQRRLQTAKTLHTLELETAKSKHTQQVVDLAGQLDSYQHQVERQNSELQKWRRKYNHLEEMAVTPIEAKDVLRELEELSPRATREEYERVQAKAIRVLQRMVQLQIRQQKERQIMDKTRTLAHARTSNTQAQLDDLRLQLEILQEDCQIPPEEWQHQIAQQRRVFEKEIKDTFKQEERRMVEMENLEVQLTELAFLAVDIEDLERESHENKDIYAEELSKARQELASTTPLVQKLQAQMKQVLGRQRKILEDLELSWSKGVVSEKWQGRLAELSRAKNPHEQLLRREQDLRQTQDQLVASQRRVRELEAEMQKLRSNSTVSTPESPSSNAEQLSLN